MTTIRKIVTSQVDGNSANESNTGEIRPFGETGFFIDTNSGIDKLVLSMFDGQRTHLRSKVLSPGVFYGSNADSGDGAGLDTIKLIPDAQQHFNGGSYGNDQYLVIDPTAPNHIHIRAGGDMDASNADLFLGGEQNHVQVSDSLDTVTVKTTNLGGPTSYYWTFDNNSKLTFPMGGAIEPAGMGWIGLTNGVSGSPISIVEKTNAEGHVGESIAEVTLISNDPTQGRVYIGANDLTTGQFNSWQFDFDGTVTFPNNAVLDSADGNIEFRLLTNFNVEAGAVVNIVTDSADAAHSWQFGDDGNLTVPGNIAKTSGNLEITADNYVIIDSTNGGQIDIGANQADGTPNSATILVGHAGNTLDIAAGKVRINATTPPTHSTGAVGDVAGLIAFDNDYIYYCTANYGATGHQVTVATLYNGGTSINSNMLQLTKTVDTLQITVGDIISDSDGGATSVVGIVSHDDNYTYVNTGVGGGIAYSCVFPLTFTSTDPAYVPGGNIWKRVAWGGSTW